MKTKNELKRMFLAGLFTILPAAILIAVALWLYRIVASIVTPLLGFFNITATFLLTILTLGIILILIILVGSVVLTPAGKQTVSLIENGILQFVPGYTQLKRLTKSFQKKHLAKNTSGVVLVDIHQNGTLMTGFITDQPTTNYTTVFIPTGPNPTSGLIYHVPNRFIYESKANAQDAFETIVAVGKNSQLIFKDVKLPKKGK